MAISSWRIFNILQGVPTADTASYFLLGAGSAGTPGAKRRLIHPDNDIFSPILYWGNPTRTFNLDNTVLPAPITNIVRTLSSTQLIRFEELAKDVIITEIWTGEDGVRASMPTFFWRQLYEYLMNPPAFHATNQQYIQWEPRDRVTDKGWYVQLFRVAVGGGQSNNQMFDIADVRPSGGWYDANHPNAWCAGPLDNLDVAPTGVIDRTVILQMRIVEEYAI